MVKSEPLPLFRSLTHYIVYDWRTRKYLFFGILLLFVTTTSTLLYYLNYPQVELNSDTPAYLHVVNRIQTHPYLLVDVWRLPIYPLFIVCVYAIAGQHNLAAVSVAQGVLFVLMVLEIYGIALLLLKRVWVAWFIGLLIGTNLILLSFVKPIMSEGLAMWLLTTFVLALLYFLRTSKVKYFWLAILCFLLLLFTRPEWQYLPLLLSPCLFFVAVQQGKWRRLLPHFITAFVLIYTLLGVYIGVNTFVNGYSGPTAIENFNWFGKILQYHMWNEVSPRYVEVSHQIDRVVAHVDTDPYHVLRYLPTLAENYNKEAGNLARDTILHHPIEFLLKSVPAFLGSLTTYYNNYPIGTVGRYEWALGWLKSIQRLLYNVNGLFPLCALVWGILFFWRKTEQRQLITAMGLLALIVFYGIAITTLGGYRFDDYMRIHTVFSPLLLLLILISLFLFFQTVVPRLWRMRKKVDRQP